jgi:pyrroloquinoline quinone (PQQ) biosynthesis protein C
MLDRDRDAPLTIVVGREYFELSEEYGTREQFLTLKRYFDGRYSVDEMSALTGVPVTDIRQIVESFDSLGLLRNRESSEFIDKESFLAQIEATCQMWSRQIGYHRLFSLLRSGEVRREVFVGLLLETYHYVRSAPRHISIAMTHCTQPEWEELLFKYLKEEGDHSGLIVQTLANLGVSPEMTISAHPIIGTMSLINNLCETARRSTLAYLTCTALFEGRDEDFNEAKTDLEAIGANYGCSAESLAPLIKHLWIDLQAGHKSLLAEALKTREMLTAAEVHFAVNCLHDLKHSFDQFHDQILQYYTDISNYIPRLTVDYFSL